MAPSARSDKRGTTDGPQPRRLIRLRRVIDRFRGRLGERRTEREAEDRHETIV